MSARRPFARLIEVLSRATRGEARTGPAPRRKRAPLNPLEELEARTTPANLQLIGAILVDGTNAPVTGPVYGQNTYVRADWASQDMDGTESSVPVRYTANYPAGYFTPGSAAVSFPADSGSVYHGGGDGTWFWWRGGWYAGTGTFTITVTIDPDDQIAETDEADNTHTITVTPAAPTDLPMKFLRPIGLTPNRDWANTNYADVDPRSGSQADYRLGQYVYDGHDAIDAGPVNFAAQDAGIPITAVADGVIDQIDGGDNFDRETSWNGGQSWNAVWVNHGNGWRTLYGHLAAGSTTVKVGDTVTAGRVLGLMGSSGFSTGTHVHYTAFYRGAQVEAGFSPSTYWADPLPYAGDVPGFYQEAGITNYSPFQYAGEIQEKPAQYTSVGANAPGGQLMYFYLQGYNLKTTDVLYFQWVRPNGTVLNTSSFSPSGNFAYSTWWWSRPQSGFQNTPGTWQVVYYLNGTAPANEQKRASFTVVSGAGAGSLRMTDPSGQTLIDGRTTAVHFGAAAGGGSAPQRSFTVTNVATGPLTLSNFVLPQGFSLVSAPPSLAGGASGTVTVRMDTATAGSKFGSVRFDTNDPDVGTFEFVVSGTVTGPAPAGSPVLGSGGAPALAFAAGSPALVLTPAATLTDPDSTAFGSLTVSLATFGGPDDRLGIRDEGTGPGQVGVSGSAVTYAGVSIGTFAGGVGTAPLVVTLGANATPAATQALLRNVTYRNASAASTTQRKAVQFALTDDTGKASNLLIRHVINSPDTAPTIRGNGGGASAAVSVAENTTAVAAMGAVDPDPGQPLTYTLTGPDAARFAVNSSTGALAFVAAPDFENPTDAGANNVYDVTVQVSDGLLTDTQNVAVTVTDVAGGAVQFAAATYSTTEGNTGTTAVTLTVTRTGTGAASVGYSTADGTATAGSDYTAAAGTLSWDAGDVAAKTITVPVVGDVAPEGNETFTVTLSALTAELTVGAPNPATVTITNDDTLKVTALTPTTSGFVLDFNAPLDAASLNLHTAAGIDGPADVTLTGPAGEVRGSLLLNAAGTRATFVATGAALPAGEYTLRLRGAANGFAAASGNALDGDADGTAGGDFASVFAVVASTARVVGVPDFARGYGQPVNVPATAAGLPLRISDAAGVTGVEADLFFDGTLLAVATGTFPGGPFGGTLTVTAIPGGVHLSVAGLTAAAGADVAVAALTASVPDAAPYAGKQILQVRNVSVNGGAIGATGDDAVHVAAYLGDATGNRALDPLDGSRVAQVASGLSGGFAAHRLADPVIVADATGDGALDPLDATRVAQKAAGLTVPAIPDLPAGVTPPAAGGPDPRLYLVGAEARPGQTVTVRLRMEVTEPGGVAVEAAEYALRFDPAVVRVSNVRTGSMLAGFATSATADNAAGTVRVGQVAGRPVTLPYGDDGDVLLFDVTVLDGAPAGATVLNLVEKVEGNGSATWTGLDGPGGRLVLAPAPTDAATDPGDAVVTVSAVPVAQPTPGADVTGWAIAVEPAAPSAARRDERARAIRPAASFAAAVRGWLPPAAAAEPAADILPAPVRGRRRG